MNECRVCGIVTAAAPVHIPGCPLEALQKRVEQLEAQLEGLNNLYLKLGERMGVAGLR